MMFIQGGRRNIYLIITFSIDLPFRQPLMEKEHIIPQMRCIVILKQNNEVEITYSFLL